jgi:competence protein ComEC
LSFESYRQQEDQLIYQNKKILIVEKTKYFSAVENRLPVDLVIISGNPKLYFNKLNETFSVKQVVFDGSCPAWKINYWKKDCDSLRIPYHDVNEKGAFVMNLQ